MELLKAHQLDIMLFMSGMCGVLAFLSFISKALNPKRRRILTILETAAMLLLIADWYAYRFHGVPGQLGSVMVRVSNFLVFLLPLVMIHEVTLYLQDLFQHEVKLAKTPRRLRVCEFLFTAGVLLLIVSQFTGLYYSFWMLMCRIRKRRKKNCSRIPQGLLRLLCVRMRAKLMSTGKPM